MFRICCLLVVNLMLFSGARASTVKPAFTRGGKPFFPIGLYGGGRASTVDYVRKTDPSIKLETHDQLLQMLKERHFNTMVGFPCDRESLEALERFDMYAIVSGGYLQPERGVREYTPESVEKVLHDLGPLADRVLAWYLRDEPWEHEWPEMKHNRAVIAEVDPNQLTFSTCCRTDHFRQIGDLCDVLGIDPYPLFQPTRESLPIDEVSKWYDIANKHTDTPIVGIPQCFAADNIWREPTTEELRCMVYQHLVGGARGLLYYSMSSGEKYSQMPPHTHWFLMRSHLWEDLKYINSEVAQLADVWLAPPLESAFNCSNPAVRFTCRASGDDVYLIAVNTSRHPQIVQFYAEGVQSAARLFDEGEVQVNSLGLRDSFPPLARRVYKIEGSPKAARQSLALTLSKKRAVPGEEVAVSLTSNGEPKPLEDELITTAGVRCVGPEGAPYSVILVEPSCSEEEVFFTCISGDDAATTRLAVTPVHDPSISRIYPKHVYGSADGAPSISLQITGKLADVDGLEAQIVGGAAYECVTPWARLEKRGDLLACALPFELNETQSGTYPAFVRLRFPPDTVRTAPVRLSVPWRIPQAGGITIDGDLSDWRCDPVHVVRIRDDNGFGRPVANEKDLSLDIRGAWDVDHLYLGIAVTDDHFVRHAGEPDEIWKGDAIQLGFDTSNDGIAQDMSYGSDDYEFGIGLSEDGVVNWCWVKRGEWSHTPASAIETAITNNGQVTSYEIAIPWSVIGLAGIAPGDDFAITIAANDNDPGLPRRELHWGGSIVGPKFVGDFIDVVLSE